MILRLAALGAIVLGLVALLAFLQIVGKAPWSPPEMRHLRAMKDRTVAPERVTPFSFADFQALPHTLSVAAYAPLERRGVSLEGYVQRLEPAPDGDVHFEVVATPRRPGGPDTVYVTTEVTPQWGRDSDHWSFEGLVTALRPNRGGATAWDSGPRRARMSGWLMYDFQDDPPFDRRPRWRNRILTGWEIHPVTRIELWDAADSTWRELER